MSNLSRIQCAVDFSDASLAAFDYGLALAKAQSAELSLVFAVPLDVRFNWRARERMDLLDSCRLTIAENVPVSVNVQQGDPAEVILLDARARKPDALVIGTHGRIGMDRFRRGSVATRVVQGAPCPTFVVRAFPSDRRVERFGRFDRILCATDFSPASGAALNQAIDLIRRGKRLTLLSPSPTPVLACAPSLEFRAHGCVATNSPDRATVVPRFARKGISPAFGRQSREGNTPCGGRNAGRSHRGRCPGPAPGLQVVRIDRCADPPHLQSSRSCGARLARLRTSEETHRQAA